MEQETLYTAAKWDILKSLAKSKKAPIELAEEANTSVSNISQSLRFLELAGLIKSERLSNRDKGKPRVMYSLAKDIAYIIVTSQGFVQKKQLDLDIRKKIYLKIWLFENKNTHRFLEKAIEGIEKDLSNYEGIFLDLTNLVDVRLKLVLKPAQKSDHKDFSFTHNGVSKKIKYQVSSWDDINKETQNYYSIHDPLSNYKGEIK